jgi:hypothetical protein
MEKVFHIIMHIFYECVLYHFVCWINFLIHQGGDNKYEWSNCGMTNSRGKSKRLGENRAPVPLCPQISHCHPRLNTMLRGNQRVPEFCHSLSRRIASQQPSKSKVTIQLSILSHENSSVAQMSQGETFMLGLSSRTKAWYKSSHKIQRWLLQL